MTRKKIGVLLLMALLVSFGANAQRATFMRINEVMVINENDIQMTMDNTMAGSSFTTHPLLP
jgi:hypothetical protein